MAHVNSICKVEGDFQLGIYVTEVFVLDLDFTYSLLGPYLSTSANIFASK